MLQITFSEAVVEASLSSVFRRTMKIYLRHVPSVLGLSELGTAVSGGSAVLETNEVVLLTTVVRSWCPSKTARTEKVLYRTSRDGWTAGAFHKICDSSASIVTLVWVKPRDSTSNCDSVLEGFSIVPW